MFIFRTPILDVLMDANDTQVIRRDNALVMATLRKALLKPVESDFAHAAWIALERIQGRSLHGLLGPLD